MSKKDLLSQCREALGDATLTNLDLLNLIGEMKKNWNMTASAGTE